MYLVDDQYIGDGRTLRVCAFLALLVLKTLENSVSFQHGLETVSEFCTSDKQLLEKGLRRTQYESFIGLNVRFFRVPCARTKFCV